VKGEGGKPQDIVLEITETEAASHLGRELENLARLRLAGFGLSIDDYGTGCASTQQLMHIAFSELKVDRSFVTSAASLPSVRGLGFKPGHCKKAAVVSRGGRRGTAGRLGPAAPARMRHSAKALTSPGRWTLQPACNGVAAGLSTARLPA
jgi:hypothetical protein